MSSGFQSQDCGESPASFEACLDTSGCMWQATDLGTANQARAGTSKTEHTQQIHFRTGVLQVEHKPLRGVNDWNGRLRKVGEQTVSAQICGVSFVAA